MHATNWARSKTFLLTLKWPDFTVRKQNPNLPSLYSKPNRSTQQLIQTIQKHIVWTVSHIDRIMLIYLLCHLHCKNTMWHSTRPLCKNICFSRQPSYFKGVWWMKKRTTIQSPSLLPSVPSVTRPSESYTPARKTGDRKNSSSKSDGQLFHS